MSNLKLAKIGFSFFSFSFLFSEAGFGGKEEAGFNRFWIEIEGQGRDRGGGDCEERFRCPRKSCKMRAMGRRWQRQSTYRGSSLQEPRQHQRFRSCFVKVVSFVLPCRIFN